MRLETLKTAKKEKGLTLQQIADISGIPKRTVDQIFSGKTLNPRIDTVQAIESALGLTQSPEWSGGDMYSGVTLNSVRLTQEQTEWLELRGEILRVMGEEYFNMLCATLNALLKNPPKP